MTSDPCLGAHKINNDVINALKQKLPAGPLQTATGLQFAVEAAIHSMRCMFEDDRTDAVILVGTRNAFNSLNH